MRSQRVFLYLTLSLLFFGFFLGCATTGPFPKGKIIDLTHSFSEETIYWPTEEGFVRENEYEGVTEAGFYFYANKIRLAEHGGTHIDAPRHFGQGQRTVDEIPLTQLMGEAVLVDVSAGR